MTDFTEQLSNSFKALSDPTRLKLIRLLMFNDEDKLRVIDLADKIGISQPAATQHINILKSNNLIQSRREQNRKYYFINQKEFKALKNKINKTLEIQVMRCTFKGKCSECPTNRLKKKKKN